MIRSAKTSARGFSIARFALFLPAKRQSQKQPTKKQQPRLRVSSAQTRLSKCRSPSAAPLSRRQIARREQGCRRARFSGQSLANTPCVVFKLKRKSLASNSFDAAFWLSVQIAAATKTIVPTPLPNTVSFSFSVSSWRSQRLTSPSGEASGSHHQLAKPAAHTRHTRVLQSESIMNRDAVCITLKISEERSRFPSRLPSPSRHCARAISKSAGWETQIPSTRL